MSTIRDAKFEELRRLVIRMPGQRLPGERELAEQFVISRPRLRAILATLESEGLVQRRHGSGTYALDLQRPDAPLQRVALWIDSSLKLSADPFVSHVIEQLQYELQETGARCHIERTNGQSLPRTGDDGIVTLGAAGSQVLTHWEEQNPPLVNLFITEVIPPGTRASILQIEDHRAGTMAAQRLVEHGAEQILFFGRQSVPVVQERLAGVRSALANSPTSLQVVECSLNYAAGVEAGRATKLPKQKKVGIIAANDWLAVGLHAGLMSQNAISPAHIKMVSFDGLPLTHEPVLGIESLTVPIEAMAHDTVAELIRLRQRGTVGRLIHYPLFWRTAGDS